MWHNASLTCGRLRTYGWANLSVAALAMVATLPGRTQGLGLVTEPLIADLQVDRVTYATINLWATLIGALFCLPCGRLTDRFGSRVVLTALLFGLGITVLVMAQSGTLNGLWVTVTLSRGFGQSALSVVSLALVGKWFAKRLNQAMGIYSLLVGLGFVIAFPLVGSLVQRFGWRSAWFSVGIALGVLMPIVWLVVRNEPLPEKTLESTTNDQERDVENLLGAAGRFDRLGSAGKRGVLGLCPGQLGIRTRVLGIALFNESILKERGFDASTYIPGARRDDARGLGGELRRWLAGNEVADSTRDGYRNGGAGSGAPRPPACHHADARPALRSRVWHRWWNRDRRLFSVWGQVFGRRQLGRIQGCAQMLTVLASAIGPLLLAQTLERTGSYSAMFNILAALVSALAVGSWLVRLPYRSPASTSLRRNKRHQ